MKKENVFPLLPAHRDFLELVMTCSELKILNLSDGDKSLISESILYNFYEESQRELFNSLRKNYKYLLDKSEI